MDTNMDTDTNKDRHTDMDTPTDMEATWTYTIFSSTNKSVLKSLKHPTNSAPNF